MKKSFTLMEIMIASILVVILATLGMGGYIYMLENAKMKACAVNQETWHRVAEIRDRETGILGKFDLEKDIEYISRAYAEKIKKADWHTKLSYFLAKIHMPKQVYAVTAQSLMDETVMKKYGVDPQILYCPSTGNKYGINNVLQDTMSWNEIPAGTILIGDCETATFDQLSDLEPSHFINPLTTKGTAIIISVEGIILETVKEHGGDIKETRTTIGGKSVKFTNAIYKDGVGKGTPQLSDNTANKCFKCGEKKNSQAQEECIKTFCPVVTECDNTSGSHQWK